MSENEAQCEPNRCEKDVTVTLTMKLKRSTAKENICRNWKDNYKTTFQNLQEATKPRRQDDFIPGRLA